MSAEKLREAAALMRERAEKATSDVCPAWTSAVVRHIARNCDIDCEYLDCEHADDEAPIWDRYDDAAHIASWHPAVALAVADWLDLMAEDYAPYWSEPYAAPFVPVIEKAYRIASAYLGDA